MKSDFKPEKIGWGLTMGFLPCWIIKDEDSTPLPFGPMLMGGVFAEFILSIVMFAYGILIGICNFFIHDEENHFEPMFVIWLSPGTRKTVLKLFPDSGIK